MELVKILGLCLVLASSFFTAQNHAFAAPLPGAMSTSLSKSAYTTGEHVVINWTASTNATKYGLSVWKAPYGNDQYLVFDQYVTGTSMDVGALPAGSYRVNMMPYNASGGGPVGNIIDFVVSAPVATTPPPALPGSMSTSLSKTSFTVGENIVINWTTAANATKYGLSVWKAPYGNDTHLVFDSYVTGNSKDIGSLPAGSYRVNMKPYNSVGGGPIGNIIDFVVNASAPVAQVPEATPAPTTVRPGSMKTSLSKSSYSTTEDVVINWTASTNATKYGLSVWKAPYGSDKYLVFDNYVTGTSRNMGKLPAGSYRVNMMPYNASGGGPVGNIIDFTVKAPAVVTTPSPVVNKPLVLPGSMKVALTKSTFSTGENITIHWTTSSNATKYGLTVRRAPYVGDNSIVWDNFVTRNSQSIGSLPAGNYRIKMIPYNATKAGSVTSAVDFVVTSPKQVIQPVPSNVSKADVNSSSYKSPPNPYSRPQCTWYVWGRAKEAVGVSLPWFSGESGNAKNWYSSAKKAGYTVGTSPKVNSIAVWSDVGSSALALSGGLGHVTYVESINGGQMNISEGNFLGTTYHEATLSTNGIRNPGPYEQRIVGYIYLK